MEFPRARGEWHILVITQGLIIYPQTQPRPPFYTPLCGLPHPLADVLNILSTTLTYIQPLSTFLNYYLTPLLFMCCEPKK